MPDVPKHQKKAVITLNAEIVKYFEDKRGLFKKKAGERVKYFEEVFCRKLRDMFDQHNPPPSRKLHYNLYTWSTMETKMKKIILNYNCI